MANITPLNGGMKLPQAWPIIDENVRKVNAEVAVRKAEIVAHVDDTKAHAAEHIEIANVEGASNVAEAFDKQRARIDNIVSQSGDDITEIVDAREGYGTLREKLDTDKTAVMSQLADIAINVRDVSYVINNETIQTAINMAVASTSTSFVIIPAGTFDITNLILKQGVVLRGGGVDKTILRYNGTDGDALVISGDAIAPLMYTGLESLTVYSPNLDEDTTLIKMSKSYYSKFTDVKIIGGSSRKGIGFYVNGSETGYYGTFTRVSFSSFDIGFKAEYSANAHRFFSSDFYNCNKGTQIIDSNGINFFGTTFQDFHICAVEFQDTGTELTNRNSLYGCYIEALEDGPNVQCGIKINETTKATMLFGNLYNNLRPAHPEVIDNGQATARLEWGSTSFNETLKLPTFTNLPRFDDSTKPSVQFATETRGSLALLRESGVVDKIAAVINKADGTNSWAQVLLAIDNVLNLTGKTIQNGAIQQYSDGYILVGTNAQVTERALNYDASFKMLRYRDDTGWKYLQGNKSGTSAARPALRFIGMEYFDTTLNKPVWWNGTIWVDAVGTTV